MKKASIPQANKAVTAQVIRHIEHHGGVTETWYVGIEERGSDRYKTKGRHPIWFELKSDEEARLTMSNLLGMGLMADDEYDAEPTILFTYMEK